MGKKLNHTFLWLNVRLVTNMYPDYFHCHYVNTTQNFENWFPFS